MNLFFQHVCGRMSNASVIFCNALATFDPEEEDYALKNGWAIDEWADEHPRVWFQARQTRLKVSELSYNKKVRKMLKPCEGVNSLFKPLKDCNIEALESIYKTYTKHRGFEDDMKIKDLCLDPENKYVLEHWYGDTLRAFTICRLYDNCNSMTSIQFCWDYHKPKMFLGKYSMIKELEIAKERGIDYVYMMPAYEDICVYKSYFQGFEFWDGRRWSSDKKIFEMMCLNDSKVNTIKEMDELMWDYDKNYFKKNIM
jgi:hypothetical protein